MDDSASIQPVAAAVRSLVLLPQPVCFLESDVDGIFKLMAFLFILGPYSSV
jgi:hypothetical protein